MSDLDLTKDYIGPIARKLLKEAEQRGFQAGAKAMKQEVLDSLRRVVPEDEWEEDAVWFGVQVAIDSAYSDLCKEDK